MVKIVFRILGIIIFFGSIFGLLNILNEDLKFIPRINKKRITKKNKKVKAKKLNTQEPKILKPWRENLSDLKKSKVLPPEWNSIKKVRVLLLDENLHSQLKQLRPPIKTQKKGRYILEVTFMSHETEDKKNLENGKIGIITQYNLIEIDTEEMVWEYSSSFFTRL